ncbi:hypothetical protein AcV7_005718 [Taiwanofungus camphoratus]|nr:hypothetical protein AcV7_005718 [Antrodia cinnamomea]
MNLLSLNGDVLEAILSHMSPRDACRLAETCRVAFTVSMPRFLSEVRLTRDIYPIVGQPERVTQFCRFMLTDISHRAPYLKVLHIWGPIFTTREVIERGHDYSIVKLFDRSSALALAEVLRYATCLREIHLINADELLIQIPRFTDVLAALPGLKSITLRGDYIESLQWLSRSASHPRKLAIEARGKAEFQQKDEEAFRKAMLSQNFLRSLKTICLDGPTFLLDLLDVNTTWPSVEILELSGTLHSLLHVARAFPNLRSIYFIHVAFSTLSPPAKWSDLDRIHVNYVYSESVPIPIACRVRELRLGSNLRDIAHTISLLEHADPVVLTLLELSRDIKVTEQIANAVPNLRVLYIIWVNIPIDHMAAFSKSSLAILSLDVSSSLMLSVPQASSIARQLAVRIPSLEYILFVKGGNEYEPLHDLLPSRFSPSRG